MYGDDSEPTEETDKRESFVFVYAKKGKLNETLNRCEKTINTTRNLFSLRWARDSVVIIK